MRKGLLLFALHVTGALGVFGDPTSTRVDDVVVAVVMVVSLFGLRQLVQRSARR